MFALLLVGSCSNDVKISTSNNIEIPMITSFEQIPYSKEFNELPQEIKTVMAQYIYEQEADAFLNELEIRLQKAIRDNDFRIVSVEGSRDYLRIENGVKAPNVYTLNVTVEVNPDKNPDGTLIGIKEKVDKWEKTEYSQACVDSVLYYIAVKEENIKYVNKITNGAYTDNTGISYSNFPKWSIPEMGKGEKNAIKVVDEFISNNIKNDNKEYFYIDLERFGCKENGELYIEMSARTAGVDVDKKFSMFAENIANTLKTEKEASEYMEFGEFETIKIVITTPENGDLEYIFEV